MILADKTISQRNNLPVELRCELFSPKTREIEWCVKYAGQSQYFDSFEDMTEYIRKKKFLSPKKLESFGTTKDRLLEEAKEKLAELDRIEEIRNTAEYKGAIRIAKIKNQLLNDNVAKNTAEAGKLIELYYLGEIGRHLFQLVMDGRSG